MSALPDYLITRKGTFYFHRRVPAKLVPIIGQRLWRETLKTSDGNAARKHAAQLNADCEQRISIAMQEYRRQRSASARLTPEEREVMDAAGGLAALRKATIGNPVTKRLTVLPQDKGLRGEVAIAEAVAGMASTIANANRKELAREGIDLDDARRELAEAEARVAALRARMERNLVILRKDTEQEADPELASDDPAEQGKTATLQTVLDRWAGESKAPAQHVGQYQYAVKRFHELHGRLALPNITRAHLRQYKDALAKLPKSTRVDLRNATLTRAIAIADKEGLPRIAEKTTRKHVIALSTLLSFAVGWGFLEKSPADGLRFVRPKTKVSKATGRVGFTAEQMRVLDASLALEYQTTDDDRWLPLFCAYQGCRQEEACQLLTSDVYQTADGLWVASITDAGEEQKVKNRASKRVLPIHADLIARGFLDHVTRSPGPLLFASLKPDRRGRLGGPYGKRFARHLRKRAKITAGNLAFHSLRHRWTTSARDALMPDEVQRAILGHTQGGPVTSRYGELANPAVLSPWLNKVKPFDDASVSVTNVNNTHEA